MAERAVVARRRSEQKELRVPPRIELIGPGGRALVFPQTMSDVVISDFDACKLAEEILALLAVKEG